MVKWTSLLHFLIGASALSIPPVWGKTLPSPTLTATQTLARFQWSLLKKDARGLASTLVKRPTVNGTELRSLKPQAFAACSLWYDLPKPETVPGAAPRSLQELTEKMKQTTVWIPAKNYGALAAFYQHNRLFLLDSTGQKVKRVLCYPRAKPDRTGTSGEDLAVRVVMESTTGFDTPADWARQRRTLAYYAGTTSALYTRLWAALFSGTVRTATNQWAPLSRLTHEWFRRLSEFSSPNTLSSVDRGLQQTATRLLPELARLRPDLSASEISFHQRFHLESAFRLSSAVFETANLFALWHHRSFAGSLKKASADYQLYLHESKEDLKKILTEDGSFRPIEEFQFPSRSPAEEPIPLPPG